MNEVTSAACTLKGDTLEVKIKGEIDHHTVAAVREKIDNAVYTKRPRVLHLDLRGMRFMDSSGLGLIIGRVVSAREVGAVVELSGADERAGRIFEMAGLYRMEGLHIESHQAKK